MAARPRGEARNLSKSSVMDPERGFTEQFTQLGEGTLARSGETPGEGHLQNLGQARMPLCASRAGVLVGNEGGVLAGGTWHQSVKQNS